MLADCKEKLKPVPPKPEPVTETIETADPGQKEEKKETEQTQPAGEKDKKPEVSEPPKETPGDPQKDKPIEKPTPEPQKEEVEVVNKVVTAGIENLNRAIKHYFQGDRSESEEYLRAAVPAFSGKPKYKTQLVRVYQFLAVILIENHYLDGDPSGELLKEARLNINRLRTLAPGFKLEEAYFSPKVVKIFSAGN